jgi:hypothetical protein
MSEDESPIVIFEDGHGITDEELVRLAKEAVANAAFQPEEPA